MADLPEDSGWVEGVRALEKTDPVRFDIFNDPLSALASRTKYLQENLDGSLRDDLANPDMGASIIAYRGGSVADKLDEIVGGAVTEQVVDEKVYTHSHSANAHPELRSSIVSEVSSLIEGAGGGGGAPIVWLDGQGMFPEVPEGEGIPIGLLEPGKHYILDNRSNYLNGIMAHSDDEIEEIQSLYECLTEVHPLDLKEIPVGSEFHFTLAGDPEETWIWWWGIWEDMGGNPNV